MEQRTRKGAGFRVEPVEPSEVCIDDARGGFLDERGHVTHGLKEGLSHSDDVRGSLLDHHQSRTQRRGGAKGHARSDVMARGLGGALYHACPRHIGQRHRLPLEVGTLYQLACKREGGHEQARN
jgi:hypothetical protein